MKQIFQKSMIRTSALMLLVALFSSAAMMESGWSATRSYRRAPARPAAQAAKPAAAPSSSALKVEPSSLLKSPESFLNKTVVFEGNFNSFSSLGLDYKKAMRSSKDYVSILIRRPDVSERTIPLSELKLIFPRKKSESVMSLESGDVIRVTGSVFSTALSEPWLDVSEVKVLQKIKNTNAKKECIKDEC